MKAEILLLSNNPQRFFFKKRRIHFGNFKIFSAVDFDKRPMDIIKSFPHNAF